MNDKLFDKLNGELSILKESIVKLIDIKNEQEKVMLEGVEAIRQLMEERDRYLELLQSYADAEAKRIIQFCDANIGSEKYATEWGTAKQALEKDDETNV